MITVRNRTQAKMMHLNASMFRQWTHANSTTFSKIQFSQSKKQFNPCPYVCLMRFSDMLFHSLAVISQELINFLSQLWETVNLP